MEWVTDSENKIHAIKYLGNGIGERIGTSKLTAEQVLQIRELYKSHTFNHNNPRQIGEMFGIDRKTVCQIVERKTWKHI